MSAVSQLVYELALISGRIKKSRNAGVQTVDVVKLNCLSMYQTNNSPGLLGDQVNRISVF